MATATKNRGTGQTGPALTAALAASAAADDPMALLSGMAASAPAKKGKDKLAFTDPALAPHVAGFIDADQKADEWASVRDTHAAQIRAVAGPGRLAACRRAGRVESSLVVNGALTFSQKNQFCPVDPANLPALGDAFGEAAGRYFLPTMDVSLTPEVTGDPEALKALVGVLLSALGAERFRASFKVVQRVKVSESFYDDWTLNPAVQATADPFIQSEVIKPYQPTLRVA